MSKNRILRNENEYSKALYRIEEIFDATPGTPKGDEVELLIQLIKNYESKHHPILMPKSIEVSE
jgi:HTH-type transcriptional regulator/antitoxin HigA